MTTPIFSRLTERGSRLLASNAAIHDELHVFDDHVFMAGSSLTTDSGKMQESFEEFMRIEMYVKQR